MKKKLVLVIFLMMALLYVPNVLAVNITGCEATLPGVMIDAKLPNTVHTIIVVIKIAVPVLLVIFGMLDLFKGITAQKEDDIKKGQQLFIKRLISAAIIFFVVTVVQLLVSFVSNEDEKTNIMTCANCFINGADSSGACK